MSTATTPDKPQIGWIGLGKMGLPICERLVTQGFEVATLTRNPEGRERATRETFKASQISGVVSSADLVVSAVSDDAAARYRFPGWWTEGDAGRVADIRRNRHGSPNASRRVAEAMSAIAVGYIRRPCRAQRPWRRRGF